MWDQRYDTEEYVYGTAPNEFLMAHAARIPKGHVLCLGEGEGRNGVWLAEQGYRVTAVDSSSVGLAKARRLAEARGVSLETVVADLAEYDLGEAVWDGIVSIFCHVPMDPRRDLHSRVVRALRPGGAFLLEAYTPRQLALATGGPPTAELMMDLEPRNGS